MGSRAGIELNDCEGDRFLKQRRHSLTFEQAIRLPRRESSELYGRHVNPLLARLLRFAGADIRFDKAEGIQLYDEEERPYLDFTAGFGSLNLGHNPKEVLDAVHEAQRLPAVLLVGFNPLAGALGAALSSILPDGLAVSIFGSGGAEAVEHAMKTARLSTGRRKFLSCIGGYHGLSFGVLSVCGSERFRMKLAPLLDHCELVPFGDLDALAQKLRGSEVAAFIVEPVQGEGGAVVPPSGYLKGVEELCRKFGTLMILDEIQTGFGRTGRMFAMEHDGVVPDIVTLSKSLSAGVVPLSVSVTSESVWRKAFGSLEKFDLTISTYSGNAAACAAGLKTIEIMQRDKISERAREMGDYARSKLEGLVDRHELAAAIRGQGLMLGIELSSAGPFGRVMGDHLSMMIMSELLRTHGILTSYYDFDPRVLRFEPPLIVTSGQIDRAVEAFDRVFSMGRREIALSFGKTALGGMFRR